jgi:tetratricopeptide (TPR) repeat protein
VRLQQYPLAITNLVTALEKAKLDKDQENLGTNYLKLYCLRLLGKALLKEAQDAREPEAMQQLTTDDKAAAYKLYGEECFEYKEYAEAISSFMRSLSLKNDSNIASKIHASLHDIGIREESAENVKRFLQNNPFLINVFVNGLRDAAGELRIPIANVRTMLFANPCLHQRSFIEYVTSDDFTKSLSDNVALPETNRKTVEEIILEHFWSWPASMAAVAG